MNKAIVAYAFLTAWIAAVAWSFLAGAAVEGPRTIDTGFQRLDVFVRWQFLAFGLALASALLAFQSRNEAKRIWWIGLAPLSLTALAVLAVIAFAMLYDPKTQSEPMNTTATRPVE